MKTADFSSVVLRLGLGFCSLTSPQVVPVLQVHRLHWVRGAEATIQALIFILSSSSPPLTKASVNASLPTPLGCCEKEMMWCF